MHSAPIDLSDPSRLFDALGLHPHDLEGRVAIVTGAARGIGEHTALALAGLGAKVVVADIASSGEAVAQRIRRGGGQALFVATDVGRLEAIEHLVATTVAHFGPVDILINNACQLELGLVLEQPAALWHANHATNFLGPVMLIQAIVPRMLERRHGVVISLISLEGMPFMGNYCANKMALRSMMLSLGKEIPADAGVSALSVMPGAVDTPLAREMIQSFSRLLGIGEAEVRATMSNNPGYEGLVPVEHAAAALAWFCVNAPQFHGQFVDGYLPMSRAGLIEVDEAVAASVGSQVEPTVVPNPELDLKQLIRINRSLENRILERTRELEEANARLQEASLTDALTGLWNRRYAHIAMREEIAVAIRKADSAASGIYLLLLDIDHFKWVNDTHGHSAGDAVLKELAGILISQCRVADKIIRWGGEEFLIAVKGIQADQVQLLAERIRRAVEAHSFTIETGAVIRCTCSIGMAFLPLSPGASSVSWESVVSLADLCLYAAKKSGRNRWVGAEVHEHALQKLADPMSGWNAPAMAQRGELNVYCGTGVTEDIVW